ncbi:MAG TPA: substrate-binding domain-containing protein [Longimicrobium sp.]|nr:substrate-binding domain-containing protein [Longimicrobium sp.]
MMMRKSVLVLAAAALAACGGDAGEAKGDSAAAGGTAAAGGPIRIAVIAKSSNNPVFLAARTGAEAAAREISAQPGGPRVEVMWLTPPQEDGQVQAQRIRQAVNEGANAVLISASDAGKVQGAIDDAVARGVEVMTFDSDVPNSRRFAYYGVDDVEMGRTVMRELAQQLNGQGAIAILAGNQNAPNLQNRARGVREEAANHPGIRVVDTFNHIETPQDAAAEVIRVNNAYPEVNGWAMVGGWPLFTRTLLTDLDPARTKVVAVDALPAQLAYVERGIAPVLVAQPVYQWGYVGVKTIVDKLQGRQVPERIPMEPVRVSRENLNQWAGQLRDWGFSDVPERFLTGQAAQAAPAATPAKQP